MNVDLEGIEYMKKTEENTFASWGKFVTLKRESLKGFTNTDDSTFDSVSLAIKLYIEYEYDCEIFERSVIWNKLYDKDGFIVTFGHPTCMQYSSKRFRRLLDEFSHYGITTEDYKKAKDIVSKYTWRGLQKEYLRYNLTEE